ncbi:MAG: hypothetical protein A2161_10190 [Candidatus Schekmanbacteria bacterium RBG_13_48_7]|uniref:Bacterial type II secretion system protein E domain-containing protein n=1 Tax=Candidatus Schekmanbacteria bacterium RBG_13_48_7 TaxID=1817878 RepID=A0A1F7S2R8_9BACT|nr:MAG: hypothetical protein A2161_10190 [Candidatus Schekmanbacteria bacterium RBG_13_48_7]
MTSTSLIRECIIESEKTRYIPDAIEQGFTQYGMQSFDQSLMELLKRGLISFKEALRRSSNPDDFKLKCAGIQSTKDFVSEDITTDKNIRTNDNKDSKQPSKNNHSPDDDNNDMIVDFSKAFGD